MELTTKTIEPSAGPPDELEAAYATLEAAVLAKRPSDREEVRWSALFPGLL